MFCGTLWCWTDEAGMATLWAAVIMAIPAYVAPILAALISAIPAVFAVYFAWRVGQRQIDIASRQVDIADRQTKVAAAAHLLEQQRVRAELYEKRSEIYGAARKFVNTILMSGRIPGRNPDDPYGVQVYQDFQEALGAAAFLFDGKVADLMFEIYNTSAEFYLDELVSPPPLKPIQRVMGRTDIISRFRRHNDELTEAVRPYLTINGVGEIPKG